MMPPDPLDSALRGAKRRWRAAKRSKPHPAKQTSGRPFREGPGGGAPLPAAGGIFVFLSPGLMQLYRNEAGGAALAY